MATKNAKGTKEEKVMTKETTKKVETGKVETKKEVKQKENKTKVVKVKQFTNDELRQLFTENGCVPYSNAKNTSNVVYQQWGTKSRVLQQGKGYQLLLTNGHENKKGELVETDNNDTNRFIEWYGKLSETKKGNIVGYDDIEKVKLSTSELPRERTVKITSEELLVEFIKYMGKFKENKVITE